MSGAPLEDLLKKLNDGDAVAAEQAFRHYEPYLRMVVRRHLSPDLRAKFDSLDVLQSVWVHLLQGFQQSGRCFVDAGHLRSFLIQLTRHRFIDRLRRHRRVLMHEQRFHVDEADTFPASTPQPEEAMHASELWERMLQMCPPAHRDILRLKRDGTSNSDVAAHTGLNEGSVRRILHALWERLGLPPRSRRERNES